LVSEIRDVDTAEAVLMSSLAGHLVFSSLHSSDVATALRRLAQMELPTYLLRSGILAICNQRLLRRRCDTCESAENQTCPGIEHIGETEVKLSHASGVVF